MRRGDPISAAAGVAAALALTGAAVAVTVMFRNRARALAESYRRAAGLPAEDGVVVVPGPAIEAYALPWLAGPRSWSPAACSAAWTSGGGPR